MLCCQALPYEHTVCGLASRLRAYLAIGVFVQTLCMLLSWFVGVQKNQYPNASVYDVQLSNLSSTAPELALDALNANLACTPRV